MKFAIVVFPGSNCDHDAYYAAKHVLGQPTDFVWHKETSLGGADVIVLPGGFSHGDYLRTGAIARFSPIMRAVADAAGGGPVDLHGPGAGLAERVAVRGHELVARGPQSLGGHRDLRRALAARRGAAAANASGPSPAAGPGSHRTHGFDGRAGRSPSSPPRSSHRRSPSSASVAASWQRSASRTACSSAARTPTRTTGPAASRRWWWRCSARVPPAPASAPRRPRWFDGPCPENTSRRRRRGSHGVVGSCRSIRSAVSVHLAPPDATSASSSMWSSPVGPRAGPTRTHRRTRQPGPRGRPAEGRAPDARDTGIPRDRVSGLPREVERPCSQSSRRLSAPTARVIRARRRVTLPRASRRLSWHVCGHVSPDRRT